MRTFKKQQGVATILLVLLIGITVMLITASVARALMTKKQAATAAHAQTNAQILGWTGVSAFRQFLINKGRSDFNGIRNLLSDETIINDSSYDVTAKNIRVIGCATVTDSCKVIADISANNKSSKAATTITAVYDLIIKNGTVTTTSETINLGLTGHTSMIGNKIEAETPDAKVNINIQGNLLMSNLITKDIAEITINSTGNVVIDCGVNNCSNTKYNINAQGYVHLTNGGNYGQIYTKKEFTALTNVKVDQLYALDDIKISGVGTVVKEVHGNKDVYMDAFGTAGNIEANGNVTLMATTKAQNIESNGQVKISGAEAGNIKAQGKVSLDTGANVKEIHTMNEVSSISFSKTQSIYAKLKVSLYNTTVNGNVYTGEYLYMSDGDIKKVNNSQGNAYAAHYVQLLAGATIEGNVYARGDSTIRVGVLTQREASFSSSTGKVRGNIYGKLAYFWGADTLGGKVYYLTDSPKGAGATGKSSEKVSSIPELAFTIPNVNRVPSISTYVTNYIDEKLNFYNAVDVRVYKKDANYIFTTENKDRRVFLNHLKNRANGLTYMYRETKVGDNLVRQQYALDAQNNEIPINNTGFNIGAYQIGNNRYRGALCLEAEQTRLFEYYDFLCTSEIIGYLPRVELREKRALNEALNDYDHASLGSIHTWYLRSSLSKSQVDNAVMAPGVFYFEGHLYISGNSNDPEDNAFTNTFLAEKDITARDLRPSIYSPYNMKRHERGEQLICNRELKNLNRQVVAVTTGTNPSTLSNRYLIPTNLCKEDNTFAYKLDHVDYDTSKTKDTVTIDGQSKFKDDLGYVALMGNGDVYLAGCPNIYGDVHARGFISYTDAACGNKPYGVHGAVNTQGKYNSGNVTSDFLAGTKLVVPAKGLSGSVTKENTGPATEVPMLEKAELKWARYK
ncbi:hypothetical protein [Acinetobacter wanghuae]|uniref:hypothetical protein n=1 Tax=Acinetobacter wanghuae TaxID=2662362 RepID=UPI003AF830E7